MTADPHETTDSPAESFRESAFDVLEREHRHRIRNRWLVLLIGPPAFAILSLIVLFLLPPVYKATGRVRFSGGLGGPFGNAGLTKRNFNDQVALLSSHEFTRNILEELSPEDLTKLTLQQRNSRFAAKHDKSGAAVPKLPLRTGIDVTGDPDTSMMVVTSENADPKLAAALANATIRVLLHQGTQAAFARSRTVQSFFAPRIAELQDLIREEQLQEETNSKDAAGKMGVSSPQHSSTQPADTHIVTQLENRQARKRNANQHSDRRQAITFDQLPDEATLAVVQRAATRANLNARLEEGRLKLLQSLQAEDPGSFDRLTDDAVLKNLQTSLGTAQATYDQMTATLGEKNPEMAERAARLATLRQQIAALRQGHVRAAQLGVTQAQQQAAALQAQLGTERRHVERVLAEQQSSAILEINLAVNLTLLADLDQKLNEYPLNGVLNAPLVEIVDSAVAPSEAVPFPLFRSFVLAGGVGLVLAILAIAWMQLRGRRRWSIFSLENAAGRPVLALMNQVAPSVGDPARAPEFGDPLREVRSALSLMRGSHACMTIVLTSSRSGEGTTTVVAALALLLARSGERVLLVDANLYRPALHRLLGLPGGIGLSQALTGGTSLEQAVQSVAIEGSGQLDAITAGPMAPLPSELLQSVAFDDLLRQARQQYSYVLLDSAPAGAPIAMLSMAAVDVVFLVAHYGAVDLRQIRYTEQHLKRTPFRALLVNGIPQGRLRTPAYTA